MPNPPTTWAQMIQDAVKLAKEGKPHYIEVQGKQYEGLTVWFNTLVASQGGSILKGPTTVSVGRDGPEGGGDHPRRRHLAGGRSVAVQLR